MEQLEFNYPEAKRLYERALAIWEKALPEICHSLLPQQSR